MAAPGYIPLAPLGPLRQITANGLALPVAKIQQQQGMGFFPEKITCRSRKGVLAW
jgi:hypothetical protein